MLQEGLSAASSRWASACHRVATRLGRSLIIGFVALLGLLFASQALAAAGTYRIYIDSDASAATGCSASLIDRLGPASEAGFEHQITVMVDAAGNVNNATHAACTGTAFSGADPIGLTAPRIDLVSRGANLLGQLELAVPLQAVGATPNSRIIIASDGDYINRLAPGSNAAITLNGAGTGVVPPAAGTHAIPTVTPGVLVALALLLAGLGAAAVRYLKPGHAAQWMMAFVLAALSGSGIAAITLVIDGNAEDWAGLAPLATDMTGDQVAGTADLHSLTVSLQGDEVFFRIDTVEGASPNRDLSPLDLDSTLPRFSTHPSLIASVGKPWVYVPSATDQSGQPVSLSMTQGPSGMQITGAVPSQQLAWTPAAAGVYWVTLQARDGAGLTQIQTFPIYVSDDRQLPADPTTRATPMSPTGFTPFSDHTAFLYQGADPIQTGVQSGAIDPVTSTVIRGQVLDSNG